MVKRDSEGVGGDKECGGARGSKPAARPTAPTAVQGNRKPGALKGRIKIGGKFFEPLPPEELDCWE
jgi:hypothetical protein